MKTDNQNQQSESRLSAPGGQGAFTLIELLVTISIIAVLAGLVVGGAAMAGSKARISRCNSELQQLSTAINEYKDKLGFFPPDNTNNVAVNQLYYELSGTLRTGPADSRSYQTLDNSERMSSATAQTFFGTGGFLNANEDKKEVKTFLNFKAGQHAEISSNPDVEVLVSPVPWNPKYGTPPVINHGTKNNTAVNPWRYVSTQPTNNSTSFDLWVEYHSGGKTNLIKNW